MLKFKLFHSNAEKTAHTHRTRHPETLTTPEQRQAAIEKNAEHVKKMMFGAGKIYKKC